MGTVFVRRAGLDHAVQREVLHDPDLSHVDSPLPERILAQPRPRIADQRFPSYTPLDT